MAFQLKLVLAQASYQDITDVDSISLAGFTDGIDVVDRSWLQSASIDSDGYVTESMSLHINAATQDLIAAKLTALADKIRQSQEQYGAGDNLYVFLRSQATYESNGRQAHVRNIALGKMDATIGDTFDRDERILSLPITLERGPWETLVNTTISISNLGQLGGTYDLSPAVVGDLPARLQWLRFNDVVG